MENTVVKPAYYCDHDYVPSAIEYLESFKEFGIGLLTVGSILTILTLYFAIDACHNVLSQKDSQFYKANVIVLLFVYPVASFCSLMAIAIPRGQLLSDAVTQVFLTVALYRLYLFLLDVGRRKITDTPPMMLRVPPCCCWPCLPFPNLEITDANLSWLKILALQLPIVQSFFHFILLFMAAEDIMLFTNYNMYIQPFIIISILLGMYSLNVTMRSLHNVAPEAKLRIRMFVSQMVLVFSNLQACIFKILSSTGLFPCNPPLTPEIYANVTSNALMLVEMLLLCYVARHVYYVDLEKDPDTSTATSSNRPKAANQTDLTSTINDKQFPTVRTIA